MKVRLPEIHLVKITKTQPDILIDKFFNLKNCGIGGTIIHTPGIARVSLSIILDSNEALIGAMIRPDKSGDMTLGIFMKIRQPC